MISKQSVAQESVQFSINIPGQSLSFSQYLWGTRLLKLSSLKALVG